jgi:hypothetical protein
MRQLRHSNMANIRKAGFVASAVVGIGIAISPLMSDAQPQSRDRCSASVQHGSMPSLTTTGRHVRLVNSPLLEENAYLSLSLPEGYMTKVGTAARARPEGQRRAFVIDVIQRNQILAITSRGSRTSVTFECASIDTAAAASARPSASSPRHETPPPQPTASQRPAEAPDAGTQQDGGAQRHRVFRP